MKPQQPHNRIHNRIIQNHQHQLPIALFLTLCLNAVCAPAVLAATGGDLSKLQAWAIALLGLTVIALSGYLFVVMFQPERF
jgi:K+-transporting ATPase KdpF subunit